MNTTDVEIAKRCRALGLDVSGSCRQLRKAGWRSRDGMWTHRDERDHWMNFAALIRQIGESIERLAAVRDEQVDPTVNKRATAQVRQARGRAIEAARAKMAANRSAFDADRSARPVEHPQ